MELRQLEYFVTVADEASFTRAAARVHVAQPGVSAQIRRLERELGHPLLDRTVRTVRLTEAGAAVLPYARAALGAVAAAHHGHPLAARTSLPLSPLRNHPLIALPPGTGLRTALDHALRAANLQPHIAFEATDPRALI